MGARRIYGGVIVAIVLNLVLVPLLGATGAALAAVLALAVAAVLVGMAVNKRLGATINRASPCSRWLRALASAFSAGSAAARAACPG